MAETRYMTINPEWVKDDNMNNYLGTGWTNGTGSSATQQDGYVNIVHSAGTDLISFSLGSVQTFPYVIDCLIESKGAENSFRVGDGSNLVYLKFPDTGGNVRYYRIIIREISGQFGSVEMYENGKLIKTKADSLEVNSSTALQYYVNSGAVSGDYLNIYHHKHSFAEDWGEPSDTVMRDSIKLDGSTGYRLLFKRVGLGAPPISIAEDQVPFEAGSIERVRNIEARTVTLGLLVEGADPHDVREKIRYLRRNLLPKIKLFTASDLDGYRFLICRYVSGLEGDENESTTAGTNWQKVILNFKAFDPFWYATRTVMTNFNTFTDVANSVARTINYNGECTGYLDIYLRGPGLPPVISNKSTGESLSLSGTNLISTNVFHIRTKPGERFIKNENYALSWNRLSQGSNQFFGLTNGKNQIEIRFPGAGTSTGTYGRIIHRETMLGE